MPRPQKPIESLNSFFGDIAVTEQAVQTRTKIGEYGDKLARITMTGYLRAGDVVAPSEYRVNLAGGYRFEAVGVVVTALWKVVNMELYEQEAGRKFALLHSDKGQKLETPEEVFNWYDAQDRKGKTQPLTVAPQVHPNLYVPNIYTPTGIAELLKYGKFKDVNTDG